MLQGTNVAADFQVSRRTACVQHIICGRQNCMLSVNVAARCGRPFHMVLIGWTMLELRNSFINNLEKVGRNPQNNYYCPENWYLWRTCKVVAEALFKTLNKIDSEQVK